MVSGIESWKTWASCGVSTWNIGTRYGHTHSIHDSVQPCFSKHKNMLYMIRDVDLVFCGANTVVTTKRHGSHPLLVHLHISNGILLAAPCPDYA